jgi:hypothetical protein
MNTYDVAAGPEILLRAGAGHPGTTPDYGESPPHLLNGTAHAFTLP